MVKTLFGFTSNKKKQFRDFNLKSEKTFFARQNGKIAAILSSDEHWFFKLKYI